jgi:hypothetical protein
MATEQTGKTEAEKKGPFGFSLGKKTKGDTSKPKPAYTGGEGVDGMLVPPYYRSLSKYRNHPFFRVTSLILFATLIAGGLEAYKWWAAKERMKLAETVQRTEIDESTKLQQQANSFKAVKAKFRELETLRRQLRVPMTPLLNAVEKTIPKDLSVTLINWTCPPIASTKTTARKAAIQLNVYFPEGVDSEKQALDEWLKALETTLGEAGLKMDNANWAPPKRFEPTQEQMVKHKGGFGSTRSLNFNISLKQLD